MGDASFGVGMLIVPQIMEQLMPPNGNEPKLVAICPKCGSRNDYPYKYCKECGGPSILIRRLRTCPKCGESFDLEKPPVCCPYCTERF